MSGTHDLRPVDPDLERRRFLYVLSEALEKLSHLRQILERQKVFITAELSDGGGSTAVDPLIEALNRHAETFLANSTLVAQLMRGDDLNEGQRKSAVAALYIFITTILQIHEMLLLLPREAAKPQASFLLRDCSGRKDLKSSIVLTNLISAYEYRFEDVLDKVNVEQNERGNLTQGGNVLCQAFADKDNPLAWAVLAHEYGHALDDEARISQRLIFGEQEQGKGRIGEDIEFRRRQEWSAAVVAETVADFVAAHMLGPASLMPILFVEMMSPRLKRVDQKSAGHPPTPLRVRLVCKYLENFGVSAADFQPVFEVYEFDYERKLQDMEESDREKTKALAEQAKSLLSTSYQSIESEVNSLRLRQFNASNSETAKCLMQILSKQPIASRRKRTDEEIYEALDALKGEESTPEHVYGALDYLNEDPVAASEILGAGWLHRLSTFEAALTETFPGNGEGPDLGVYRKYVEKIDGMLQKSLELAAVHAEVLQKGRVRA